MNNIDAELRDWAYWAGMDQPERCWLSTPLDSWIKNPHYTGVEQRHPEDDSGYDYDNTDVMLAINEQEHDVPTVTIPILCEWIEMEADAELNGMGE
jgi:hypothetical protein